MYAINSVRYCKAAMALLLAFTASGMPAYAEPPKVAVSSGSEGDVPCAWRKGPCGWYFYEDPAPAKEDKKPSQDITLPDPVIPPRLADKYSIDELMAMHPKKMEKLMELYRQKGMQDPSPANVYDYYVLQDVMLRKSDAYSNTVRYVMQTHPEFNREKDYPITVAGNITYNQQREEEIRTRIARESSSFAVIYFKREGCHFCEKQNGIMQMFIAATGMEVKDVDIEERPELARHFDVAMVPYLILVGRGEKYVPISVGLTVMDEIMSRVYNGIRYLSGEISPSQWGVYEFQRGGTFDPAVPTKISGGGGQ